MLSEAGSIAFGSWEHCFGKLGALLLEAGSYAFRGMELCFWPLFPHFCKLLRTAQALVGGYFSIANYCKPIFLQVPFFSIIFAIVNRKQLQSANRK